ncbi:MAG: VOC family protein [Angustibacter sp.]
MDMVMGDQLAAAGLTDWRKLAQGLHARYLLGDFAAAVRFVTAIGQAGDAVGHHPRVAIGEGFVDLELVTQDAVYRDDDGTDLVLEWVTQQDVNLARRITQVAAEQGLRADPSSVSEVELGLDTATSATIAPVWAALLTGHAEDQGRGTPGDEIRDSRGRLPNLWFGDLNEDEPAGQRFHVEVYVAPEVVQSRVAAVVAAGGTVVDDSNAPGLTVIADQDGNRGVICADVSAAPGDRTPDPPSAE